MSLGCAAVAALFLVPAPGRGAALEPQPKAVAVDPGILSRPLNEGWRFSLGETPGAEAPGFDDGAWERVDLPHDWNIEARGPGGPHDKDTPEGASVGYFRGGTGWYRKHFAVAASDAGKEMDILFDGVQQDCDVWINGSYLGFQPHGYIAFHYAMSAHLNGRGRDNVIAVRAVNPDVNSRWYAGSGLYRQVSVRAHDPLHIPVWGARVDTVWLFEGKALLQLALDVQNDRPGPEDLTVELVLNGPDGVTSVRTLGKLHVVAGAHERMNESLILDPVRAWSPDRPELYQAEFRLIQKDKVVDCLRQAFGVRTISVSSETGLLVNGVPVKLKGGCIHHDNGILGAEAFPDAELRRVAILKENGFNAIRTSHNPPSSAFLDACDSLGMLVVDEFADSWELPKKANGYQRYFDAHWEHDLSSMIARDYNHPSVIVWSIGNEIPERADSPGVEIGRRLAAFVHRENPRRPVTNAICGAYDNPSLHGEWEPNAPAIALVDIGGYNYFLSKYESDHAANPGRVMMGTESFPRQAFENWREIAKDSYVLGDFVWTAMDYAGESGIGHSSYEAIADGPGTLAGWAQMPWPWWISWCGDLDITGVKKPQSFYRDVVWERSPVEVMVHEPVPAGMREKVGLWGWPAEFPSWNWPGQEGRVLSVNVYSRAQRVRLELNGRLVGECQIDAAKGITATFAVPYEPGILKASALEGGQVVGTRQIETTGPASAVRVLPEHERVTADRQSLIYIPVEIVDAKGAWVPEAAVPLTLSVGGPAELKAFGTGNPTDVSPLQGPRVTSFRGRALAILRSTGKPGKIVVSVKGAGVTGASAVVEAVPCD